MTALQTYFRAFLPAYFSSRLDLASAAESAFLVSFAAFRVHCSGLYGRLSALSFQRFGRGLRIGGFDGGAVLAHAIQYSRALISALAMTRVSPNHGGFWRTLHKWRLDDPGSIEVREGCRRHGARQLSAASALERLWPTGRYARARRPVQ